MVVGSLMWGFGRGMPDQVGHDGEGSAMTVKGRHQGTALGHAGEDVGEDVDVVGQDVQGIGNNQRNGNIGPNFRERWSLGRI